MHGPIECDHVDSVSTAQVSTQGGDAVEVAEKDRGVLRGRRRGPGPIPADGVIGEREVGCGIDLDSKGAHGSATHRVARNRDGIGSAVAVGGDVNALVGAASDRDSADGHIPGTGVDAVAAAGSDAATADRDRRAGRIDPVAAAVGNRGGAHEQSVGRAAHGRHGTAVDGDRVTRVTDGGTGEVTVATIRCRGTVGVER